MQKMQIKLLIVMDNYYLYYNPSLNMLHMNLLITLIKMLMMLFDLHYYRFHR